MKAAIYARFSTDKQSETSIDDQVRVCRARADQLGFDVVVVHSDQATSGATLIADRAGGRALLVDALTRRFDVLIVEGLDRLSRDAVDQEQTLRRLEHRDIRIIGVADSYDTASGDARKILRGVRGMINEAYVDDLRKKTHRGLAGQLARGYHAGGLSYGYRSSVAGVDPRGEPIGHFLEIDADQATVVREIFARYAGGESCQAIVAALNARGVAGPRGRTWCVSAIYGSPERGIGVLNNELYVGRQIWNRTRWTKDPDTRKRERFERPRAEWIVAARPQLRIVDDELWRAVRARMSTKRDAGGRKGAGRMPTTLFGGILRCGTCGGAVVKVDARRYGCAARKDRGAAVCRGVSATLRGVDSVLLEHLRATIANPAMLAELERMAVKRARELAHAADGASPELRKREVALRAEIMRLVDAIATVGVSPALSDRLARAETELDGVKRARTRAGVETLPSAIRAHLRAAVADLVDAIDEDVTRAREALRETFGPIQLKTDEQGAFVEFENAAERLMLAVGGAKINLVAGACSVISLRVP